MSDGAQRGSAKLEGAMGEAFGEGWRRRVADDPHEPALEQLAAFAEGRLTPREEAQVAREIAASPAALEILSALVGDSQLWRRLPVDGSESAAAAPTATLRMPTAAVLPRERRSKHLAAWAVAACVAVAATGIVMNQQGRQGASPSGGREVARVEQDRADRASAALLVNGKTQVAELEQSEQMPYIVGRSSAQWAALADQTVARSLAGGGVRGGADLTEEDAAAIARAKDDLFTTAQEFMMSGLPGRIEHAAALIQAGRVDDAQDVLEEIKGAASEDELTLAQWRNLRGSLLAKQAADAPMTEAEPLLAEAEELFRQAAEGGVDEAWLNLAMVLVEQGDTAEAEAAQLKYRAGAEANPTSE